MGGRLGLPLKDQMEKFQCLFYISHSLLAINIPKVEMCCIMKGGLLPFPTIEPELYIMGTLSGLLVFLICEN